MVAVLGEFIGTTMFLFFAFAGTQVANIGAGQTTDNSTTGSATGFKYVPLHQRGCTFYSDILTRGKSGNIVVHLALLRLQSDGQCLGVFQN